MGRRLGSAGSYGAAWRGSLGLSLGVGALGFIAGFAVAGEDSTESLLIAGAASLGLSFPGFLVGAMLGDRYSRLRRERSATPPRQVHVAPSLHAGGASLAMFGTF